MTLLIEQAVWALGAVLLMIALGSGAGLCGAAMIGLRTRPPRR